MAAFPIRAREAHAAHWKKVRADAGVRLQTILVDGRVAGNVVSFESEGRRLVGYWIGREFWSRGIASRALALFLEHDTARPLEAFVAKHNAGSIRVLEKNGFVRVGGGELAPESTGAGEPVAEWLMRLET
jgi:RimJ/RimL family protein N-acetyltransferase